MLRNEIEIGRSQLRVEDVDRALGSYAFIVKEGEGTGEGVLLRGAAAHNWMAVALPGAAAAGAVELASVAGGQLRVPRDFASNLYPLLQPGTTLFITDAPVLEQATGQELTVLANGSMPL